MKKLIKAFAAAGTVAMLGVAVVPLTAYAATTTYGTTTVQVILGEECNIGDGTGTTAGTAEALNTLRLELDLASNPADETNSNDAVGSLNTGDSAINIICNSSAWTLDEQINAGTYTVNLVGNDTATTPGFFSWTGGTTPGAFTTADASGNAWAMKYTELAAMSGGNMCNGTTTCETTTPGTFAPASTAYHAVPANGSPRMIAEGTAVTNYEIVQTFGARYVTALPQATYSTQILYTLTGS
jgi:hypothetical protein